MSERQPESETINVNDECDKPLCDGGCRLNENHAAPRVVRTPIRIEDLEATLAVFDIPDLAHCSWGLPELAAVAGAVGTRDLYAVSVAQGNDQYTLATEITMTATRLGRTVLVLTTEPVYADTVLNKFREVNPHPMIRALGAGEPRTQLPPSSLPFLADRVGEAGFQLHYHEALSKLEQAAAYEQQCALLAATLASLEEHQQSLDTLRANTHEMPTRPEPKAQHDLIKTKAEQQQTLASLRSESEKLQATATAKGLLASIKSLFTKDETPELLAQIQQRITTCEKELERIATIERAEEQAHSAAEQAYQQQLHVYEQHHNAISAAEADVTTTSETLRGLGYDDAPTAHVGLAQCGNVSTQVAEARQRVSELEERRAELSRQIAASVGLVVAPCSALAVDPNLSGNRVFDYVLVLDAADQNKDDLNRFAQHGHRLILLGDVVQAAPSSWFRNFVHQHAETNWGRDTGRVVAQVSAERYAPHLKRVCEALVDQPNIELQFVMTDSGRTLTSISFPPQTTAATAKNFLAQELDFIRFRTLGQGIRRDTSEYKQVVFTQVEPFLIGNNERVELGQGIVELVTTGGWTAAVQFPLETTDDEIETYMHEHIAPMPRAAILPQPLFIPERKVEPRAVSAAQA